MIKNLSTCPQFTIMDWNTLHTILDVCMNFYGELNQKNTSYSWVQFSENGPKQYRKCYFSVPKRFGFSFTTDGVCVSLLMNRLIAKKDKHKAKRVKKEETSNENNNQLYKKYEKIIAVDPEAKIPILTCSRISSDDTFEYKTMKKWKVAYETKEHHREKKRLKFVKNVDLKIRNDRESLESVISRKNSNVYTKFQLKWFDGKPNLYEQRRLQRLKFDKYVNYQKTNHKVVDEYFGKEPIYSGGLRKWFWFYEQGYFQGTP